MSSPEPEADGPITGEPCNVMVSAGEASGDMHAAHALAALADRGTKVRSFGMGAGALERGGTELIVDCRDLAVIGIVDVLANYGKFRARLSRLRRTMRDRRPDLLIIVDYPDFNLKLAETAKTLGIPVLFYISPQVWAWRAGRVARIGSLVTHMAVLFPFEVAVYERAGVPVTHVGHPLVDDARSGFTPTEARRHFGLRASGPLVTLLPGSRRGEIRRHLPVMLDSARRLRAAIPDCRFLLPLAPTLDRATLDEAPATTGTSLASVLADVSLPLEIVTGDACHAMRAADVVLAASGTATLETALIGTPMVVLYIVSPTNHAIMSRLIRIPDIALVNVVAGRRIVPEYVQKEATPSALADELRSLLTDQSRADTMRAALAEVSARMGDGGASGRVAALIDDMLAQTRRT